METKFGICHIFFQGSIYVCGLGGFWETSQCHERNTAALL